MTGGLLDFLRDPELMAAIAERDAIVDRLAEWACTTPEQARAWLDEQDLAAFEIFQPGNTVPRETLH